jgi:hypothetical protein
MVILDIFCKTGRGIEARNIPVGKKVNIPPVMNLIQRVCFIDHGSTASLPPSAP